MQVDVDAAASTGASPTLMVAIEQQFPADQRIIQDDLALRIMPSNYKTVVKLMRFSAIRDWMVRMSEKQFAGLWSAVMCRKRYIDDALLAAVSANDSSTAPITAIVNLGAGFDTRAYRLPALAHIPVWEVDQSGNIETKRKALEQTLGSIPKHVTLVPINFVAEELCTVLAAHGYSVQSKTFFIWEAVTQYLTETAVRETLDCLRHAPAGSRLAFTYVRKDFIEGTQIFGQTKFYERMVAKRKVWLFGLNPGAVADLLREYGWRLVEDRSYAELAEQYVKPTGRVLPTTEIERIAYAEKMQSA